MPNPVTQVQTVNAINTALAQMNPQGNHIDDLNTTALSNINWSCNNFSPAVLTEICNLPHIDPSNIITQTYDQGVLLPGNFANATFVNISMMGDPSQLNHNFNILVSDKTTYLIQTFLNEQVNIVRRLSNADFIRHWHNLSNNVDWTTSYDKLFGVQPNTVVTSPPMNTWLTSQYVTL